MIGLGTADEALAFVREHGVVLLAAKGPAPRLTEAIVGEPIKGSWWAHPRSHFIFQILSGVAASSEVLACRLMDGKVTLVHRRLWPALVRLAGRFPAERLAQARDEHTPSGRHVRRDVAFPHWVPDAVAAAARAMREEEAIAALRAALHGAGLGDEPAHRANRRNHSHPESESPMPQPSRTLPLVALYERSRRAHRLWLLVRDREHDGNAK